MEVSGVRMRVAVIAVGAVALCVGVASAATVDYETAFKKFKFKTEASQTEFKGKLASTKGKCVKQRKVKLIRKHDGNKQTLGTDKTNGKGKWDISLSGVAKVGKYYAQVKKKSLGTNGAGDKQVCLAEKSGKLNVSIE
jgi:hypothetical protein